MEQIDVLVVGGGVSGLASARALAHRGRSVCVLERHPRAGLETSTHNSGVVHAGLYNPPGSLKTLLAIEGRPQLYAFCEAHAVAHARPGKLVVATSKDDVPHLEDLLHRGHANGVTSLRMVDRDFVRSREPAIEAVAAIFSPETGIVDADALVRALVDTARDAGVAFLPGTPFVSADQSNGAIIVRTPHESIEARVLVNAAGLYADQVSRDAGGEAFTIYPCRGEYAELAPGARSWVNGLVYPLPHPSGHGLGVHLTRAVGGAVWIGPTARFQERRDDYEHDRLPIEAFLEPTRTLLPRATLGDLRLAGSGIRPKLHPPGESFADFLIRWDTVNPRVVQVAGIESPGLTACLAIGERVAALVDERL